jgi:hypothetical protein
MKLKKNGRTAVTRGFPRLPQGREIPTDYWVPFVNLRVLGVYCFKIAHERYKGSRRKELKSDPTHEARL